MAKISNKNIYNQKTVLSGSEYVVITDPTDGNKTKTTSVSNLRGVTYSSSSIVGQWIDGDNTYNVMSLKFNIKQYLDENELDDGSLSFVIPCSALGVLGEDIKVLLESKLVFQQENKQYVIQGNTALGFIYYDVDNFNIVSTINNANVIGTTIKGADYVYLILKYVDNNAIN